MTNKKKTVNVGYNSLRKMIREAVLSELTAKEKRDQYSQKQGGAGYFDDENEDDISMSKNEFYSYIDPDLTKVAKSFGFYLNHVQNLDLNVGRKKFDLLCIEIPLYLSIKNLNGEETKLSSDSDVLNVNNKHKSYVFGIPFRDNKLNIINSSYGDRDLVYLKEKYTEPKTLRIYVDLFNGVLLMNDDSNIDAQITVFDNKTTPTFDNKTKNYSVNPDTLISFINNDMLIDQKKMLVRLLQDIESNYGINIKKNKVYPLFQYVDSVYIKKTGDHGLLSKFKNFVGGIFSKNDKPKNDYDQIRDNMVNKKLNYQAKRLGLE